MKFSLSYLRTFCPAVPADPKEAQHLLDDLGLEVKRLETTGADTLITLELLANRGDHYCYAGVAREVAARCDSSVCLPDVTQLEVGTAPRQVLVDSELCLQYTATCLRVTRAGVPLPAELHAPLLAAEAFAGNPIVDATNLVNFEIGQPTHAFDDDLICGPVRIRVSREGEEAWLLFTDGPRQLPAGTLVIADDERILAVAGVIGCEDSKITERTSNVLLESAAFDPVAVRSAARALTVATAASQRFERGSDPTLPIVGAGRVVHPLERYGIAERASRTDVSGSWKDPERMIAMDVKDCTEFFQQEWTEADVERRLHHYGFTRVGETLQFRVPPHRLWDVEAREDLYEELARSVGYDALPSALPPVSIGSLLTPLERMKSRVEELLIGEGFYEVYTDGFYSRHVRPKLGLTEAHPLWAHVEIRNALDRSYSLLKNNCLAQAIEAVSANLRFKNDAFKAFEWTRTFHPDATAENGVCTERPVLWGMSHGPENPAQWDGKSRPADLVFLRGVVEEVGQELGIPLELADRASSIAIAEFLHPHRQNAIRLQGETVGALGEVHPNVTRAFGIKSGRPCYFEVATAALLAEPVEAVFALPPSIPPIERMLSFILPDRISVGEVLPLIKAAGPSWLTRTAVMDVFRIEEGGTTQRSVTFTLQFDNESPRTADEVNGECEALVARVTEVFGNRGVRLR